MTKRGGPSGTPFLLYAAVMPTIVRLVLVLALGFSVSGCRQADGPTPTPTGDQTNEIGDIARDMINIANKDPQAPDDLRSDLSKYSTREDAVREIDALAKAVSEALVGARLDEAASKSLANILWIAVNGKQLSERQVDALGKEVKTVLAPTGVTEERAQSIANRLSAVQKSVNENPRRWYQVF